MSVPGGGAGVCAGGVIGVCMSPATRAIDSNARIAGVYSGRRRRQRPEKIMRCLSLVLALSLTAIPQAAELTIVGAWTFNRDLSAIPNEPETPHAPRGGGGRPAGQGGISGRGSLLGLGGNSPSDNEMHRAQVIRRRLSEIPLRLIISRNSESVTIVDEIGRSQTLKADGKKQDRLTGDGEFTSKTRFEGAKLVVEEDFGGPKLITTFTPLLEAGELPRLEVTMKAENLPGAGRARLGQRAGSPERPDRPGIRRVYDAEAR